MRKRSGTWGGLTIFGSIVAAFGKDILLGESGDFVMGLFPDSTWDYISQDVITYLPAAALFVLGVMAIMGWGYSTTVHLSRPYFRRESETGKKQEPETTVHQTERNQLVPDWKIADAMDYIAAIYGNATEEDLDAKYTEPTRLLTSKARSGEIQVWGKRIFDDDNAELSQRPMKPSDWEDIQLSMWACTTSSRHSHTEPASQQGVQKFTDLHVSESQIKGIRWKMDTATKYNDPIHEAIAYIARRIGDNDADNFFESTRKAIRQAAVNSEIKIRGRKELEGEQGFPDDIYTCIKASYWKTHILNEMATDQNHESWEHTRAKDLKKELHRNRYWGLRVNMDEVKKRWP